MKTIAKAALGALALASLAAAATPADAARPVPSIGSIVREPAPCLRAPAFRPAFCFRRDMRWRAAYWHGLSPRQRMAFLQRRFWGVNR